MGWIKRIVFMLFRMWTGRLALTHMKRRGMLVYLRALQAARRSIMALIAFLCVLQVMMIGLVGAFVTGVFLFEQDPSVRLWILFAGFGLLFGLPFVTLIVVLSERVWFKASGAEKFFSESDSAPAGQPVEG